MSEDKPKAEITKNGTFQFQDLTGGYCPRCDIVWASPGKCQCNTNNKIEGRTERLTRMAYNAAIEDAAKLFDQYIQLGPEQIRKLKK